MRLPAVLIYLFCHLAGGTLSAVRADVPGMPEAPEAAPNRSRVVTVHDPAAVASFRPDFQRIRAMVDQGIARWTGAANRRDGWLKLVKPEDVVGIKVYSHPGATSGTRVEVVAAVIEGLLDAGLPEQNIVVWDKRVADLQLAGFFDLQDRYGIRVEGSADAGYDEKVFYDAALIGRLVWGDVEFGRKGSDIGRKSFVSKLLTRDLTRIISITPLLNHNVASVTGHLYSLTMGSVDNTMRFERNAPAMNTAVPELYAMKELGDKVVLNIVDGLICQYQGQQRSLLHYASVLNELRFSDDPVALDVLSIQELQKQREKAEIPSPQPNTTLYYNAALLELGVNDRSSIRVEAESPSGGE